MSKDKAAREQAGGWYAIKGFYVPGYPEVQTELHFMVDGRSVCGRMSIIGRMTQPPGEWPQCKGCREGIQ